MKYLSYTPSGTARNISTASLPGASPESCPGISPPSQHSDNQQHVGYSTMK